MFLISSIINLLCNLLKSRLGKQPSNKGYLGTYYTGYIPDVEQFRVKKD